MNNVRTKLKRGLVWSFGRAHLDLDPLDSAAHASRSPHTIQQHYELD